MSFGFCMNFGFIFSFALAADLRIQMVVGIWYSVAETLSPVEVFFGFALAADLSI